jgi:hypothetical protein
MKCSLHFLGAIVGGLLALGPLYGVFGMMRAIAILGQRGVSDPRAMSSAIGEVLLGTAGGLLVWPLGAALCAYCIVQLLKGPKQPPPLPRVSPPNTSDFKA